MASTTYNEISLTTKLPASVKDTLQKAADLTETTLNKFMVQAAVKEAQKVIEAQQVIHLSSQDADRIFSLIENPPTPNKYLKEAIQRHQVFFSEKD